MSTSTVTLKKMFETYEFHSSNNLKFNVVVVANQQSPNQKVRVRFLNDTETFLVDTSKLHPIKKKKNKTDDT